MTKFATKLQQMSDFFFVEHRYFKFQDEIQFFNTTMEPIRTLKDIAIQKAFVVAIHWRQRRRGHIPSNILVGGDVNGNIPTNIITYVRI